MIRLFPRKSPPFSVLNETFFFDLTRELFNHRRKKIKNSLDQLYDIDVENTPYLDKRVERLTPEEIGKLSNVLWNLQNNRYKTEKKN